MSSYLHVVYISCNKVSLNFASLHANFQTFPTLCLENRAIRMIFDFAEIRSQFGKINIEIPNF